MTEGGPGSQLALDPQPTKGKPTKGKAGGMYTGGPTNKKSVDKMTDAEKKAKKQENKAKAAGTTLAEKTAKNNEARVSKGKEAAVKTR